MVISKEQDVSYKDTDCVATLGLLCSQDGIRRQELRSSCLFQGHKSSPVISVAESRHSSHVER